MGLKKSKCKEEELTTSSEDLILVQESYGANTKCPKIDLVRIKNSKLNTTEWPIATDESGNLSGSNCLLVNSRFSSD
jgi:hypothetical protein